MLRLEGRGIQSHRSEEIDRRSPSEWVRIEVGVGDDRPLFEGLGRSSDVRVTRGKG